MTQTRSVCLYLFVAFTAACAAPKIGYDYDPKANFSSYHAYEWMPGNQETTGDQRVATSVVDIRIRTAVGAQLHLKGYTTSMNIQPDFYVAYHVTVKDMTPDTSSQYFSEGMAGSPLTHSVDTRSTGVAHTTTGGVQSYLTGTLLVDIIDAASTQLVWRGTAAGEIDQGLTSTERDERIRNIVQEMFSHFPPK